ncbi:hypothetical protein TWF506_009342 [Arthrobotrys conoides]|uniref:F-box domain-containing protein n=1 Tax=Arthrobotrys conoides TaxID=74498 RepID=A0AAN8RRG7_9PEZI
MAALESDNHSLDVETLGGAESPATRQCQFQRIPTEVLFNIFSFCTTESLLESVSKTCQRFRTVCVALYLQDMNVGNPFDLKMRERYSDRLLAVRNVKVPLPITLYQYRYGNTDFCRSLFSEFEQNSIQQLVDKIAGGLLPSVKSFSMAYYDYHAGDFPTVMNALSENQPAELRQLSVEVFETISMQSGLKRTKKRDIKYPRGLESIKIGLWGDSPFTVLFFDPFDILSSSYDTLKVLELSMNSWEGKYRNRAVFPGVRVLKFSQTSQDRYQSDVVARDLNVAFPGVEELWLDSREISVGYETEMSDRKYADVMSWKSRRWVLDRFTKWGHMKKVKKVELRYVMAKRYPETRARSDQRFATCTVRDLVRAWITDGMVELQTVHCAGHEVIEGSGRNVDITFEVARVDADTLAEMIAKGKHATELRVKLVDSKYNSKGEVAPRRGIKTLPKS